MDLNESFFHERCFCAFWFLVGWTFRLFRLGDVCHVKRVIAIIVLELPDLGMPHDIDDLELTDEIIEEELDGLNPKEIFQFLNVCGLVDNFHEVLGPFFVVDAIDAGLGEANGKLFEDVIA